MDAAEFIQTGLIDTYCLGFTSPEENAMIEKMAATYPEVKEEIERVRNSFKNFIHKRQMQPSPSVKTAVMNGVYARKAIQYKEWVPLMHEPIDFSNYVASANANHLKKPVEDFENVFVKELPSNGEIINYALWVKKELKEELHEDCNKYIAILSGSCDVYMNNEKLAYQKGQIISIAAGVLHSFIITSAQPMFALVQKQLIH